MGIGQQQDSVIDAMPMRRFILLTNECLGLWISIKGVGDD